MAATAFQQQARGYTSDLDNPPIVEASSNQLVTGLQATDPGALTAAVPTDGLVGAAMQLIDSLQSMTGLPWWATLSATAVGIRSCAQGFHERCYSCGLPATQTYSCGVNSQRQFSHFVGNLPTCRPIRDCCGPGTPICVHTRLAVSVTVPEQSRQAAACTCQHSLEVPMATTHACPSLIAVVQHNGNRTCMSRVKC